LGWGKLNSIAPTGAGERRAALPHSVHSTKLDLTCRSLAGARAPASPISGRSATDANKAGGRERHVNRERKRCTGKLHIQPEAGLGSGHRRGAQALARPPVRNPAARDPTDFRFFLDLAVLESEKGRAAGATPRTTRLFPLVRACYLPGLRAASALALSCL